MPIVIDLADMLGKMQIWDAYRGCHEERRSIASLLATVVTTSTATSVGFENTTWPQFLKLPASLYK